MRKGITEAKSGTVPFDAIVLQGLKDKGFKFVQVKGFTADNHYDYTAPQFLLLVPLKHLPENDKSKDIYEPLESLILEEWAREKTGILPVFIAGEFSR